MFRDLRERISPQRRALAWVILALLVAGGAYAFHRLSGNPLMRERAVEVLWIAVAFLAVRAITFLVVDPLARQSRNATPGFARDMIVVLLYILAAGGLLRHVAGVSLTQLLGTGALVAAVIGLSMQETLGNIFAGLSLSLDSAFEVGDWIEISGSTLGSARPSFVGRVEAMTWRAVQLVSWDGDTDLVPNRLMAQSVVTNLYAPVGFHRRTAYYTVQPSARMHEILDLLAVALAGVPHPPEKRPKAVVWGQKEGGVVLECQWWPLGFRHSKASKDEVNRLATTVLAREGVPLMGPHGPSPVNPQPAEPSGEQLASLVHLLHLPEHWSEDLRGRVRLRMKAPGEGVLREGDPGDSLYAVLEGRLAVVRSEQRETPYHGLFWKTIAELGPGEWLGETSLLTGAPRSATVVAATAALLLEMDKAAFEASLKREPEVLEQLADLMARRGAARPDAQAAPLGGFREQLVRQIRAWFNLA
ncbi:MAG TPA: cyclic nucleotide-binding domain-containing protein [Holophagaceae bacterium]|jgi:small-conductance mechanosensitive channel/CRP-like cAMP-binding protein|nr:cyclic nucleotide-binding domain-containing protein [Holophagaceae bacterium]